ncbi:hypothetical protein RSAG8_09963, partial [Rhizoctonia solani AG-8 WAC10335]
MVGVDNHGPLRHGQLASGTYHRMSSLRYWLFTLRSIRSPRIYGVCCIETT